MEAEKEKRTEKEIQKSVNEIREYLEKELPEARRDDRKILFFLEGCKYRMETVKTKLKNDYNFRTNTPEWFENRDPERREIKEALASGISFFPDNIIDAKGRPVTFLRPNIHDPSYSGDLYYKIVNMCWDVAMEDNPLIGRNGVVCIIDFDGTTLTHCLKKMLVTKKLIRWWTGCCPIQMKEVHVINLPSFAAYFMDISRNLLKKKMRDRFIIHKKPDDLMKCINPYLLPEEYGGTAGPLQDIVQNYVKNILVKREFLIKNDW